MNSLNSIRKNDDPGTQNNLNLLQYDYDVEKYPLWRINVADIIQIVFDYAMCSNVVASAPPTVSSHFYSQYKAKHLGQTDRILQSLNCFSIDKDISQFCVEAVYRIRAFANNLFYNHKNKKIEQNPYELFMLFVSAKRAAVAQITEIIQKLNYSTNIVLDLDPYEPLDLDIASLIEPIKTIMECDACSVFHSITWSHIQLPMDLRISNPTDVLKFYLHEFPLAPQDHCSGTLTLTKMGLDILPAEIAQFNYLQEVNLNDNYLQFLPESFFKLNNLTNLNVDYNSIHVIPEAISNLNKLTALSIAGNRLESIPLLELPKLNEFCVSSNKIKSLPLGFFNHLNGLKSLNLNNNEIEKLPDDIDTLKKLMFLGFSKNKITNLPFSLRRLGKMDFVMQISANPYFEKLNKEDKATLRSLRERDVYFSDLDPCEFRDRERKMLERSLDGLLGPRDGWLSTDWINKVLGD